jgi:PAS domain S-box-containing protein
MSIRTQFIINMIVLGSILIFVSAAVIVTNQWVEDTHQQQELAAQIEREANELSYLANEYLLYRESQQASRWGSKFASFSDHLSELQVNTPEQQTLLANIKTNQQRLKTVFEEVKASIEAAPQTPQPRFDEDFLQLSWSRLEVQNQGLIFDASRLERILNEQEHWLEQFARMLSLVLIGMLAIFLLVNYSWTFRRILQAIASLQAGTRIVGSGDLDFAIPVKSEDEIGELSRAFNQMTGKLKTITASRAELEREISERKQAEAALRESEARYRGVVESQLDLIVRVDPEGRFTFANDAYCQKFGLKREDILGRESYKSLVHPEDLPHTLEAMQALYQPPYRVLVEQRAFAVEGVRWIEWQDSTIRDARGEVVEIQAIGRDITERKQAEGALRESEQRLKRAQEIAHLGSWELDLVNNQLTWSDEVYRIFGLQPQEFGATYEAFLEAVHPQDRAAVDDAYSSSIREGRDSYEIEHRVVRRSTGEIGIVHEKCDHFRNHDGQIIRSIGMVHDITERKQAENLVQARMRLMEYAATHELEEILQETLDEIGKITNSPIGFYHLVETDQQTLSLQAWSTRTLQEFCTAQGTGLHYNVSDAGVWVDCVHQRRPVIHNDYASLPNQKGLPEGHAQVIRELVVPILRGDRIVSILGVGNKPSNYTEKDVELVSYLADVAWEIAEHKRAEEEIISLAKFPTENPNPILRVQADGRLTYANVASQELLEDWNCGVNDYLPEELRDFITVALDDHLNKTVDVFCKDKVYSLMLAPVMEGGYVNIYGRDTTERKRAEEALKHLAEDLGRSNAELEQFAYVASHDLQEPLRMISSYMQLLKRRYQGKLDKDADEFIAFAVDGAARMQNLINDLLTFSRVGTRGRPMGLSSCEKVLEEALINLQVTVEESKAIITHDPLPTVFCDQPQLVQVFQNLIGNSIKFRGQQAPQIHISAKREESEWIFSVCDNGIGLDPKFGERIFEIFQRLHSRTAYPGTGIGLAICKRIVQRHGGRIWVESNPGEGATFYFTLPVKETL